MDTAERWYVIDEDTGEEFGPYASFDEAHDTAPIPATHTFRIEER
jgi:hypothetical protein